MARFEKFFSVTIIMKQYFVLLAIIALAYGAPQIHKNTFSLDGRIVGGTDATIEEFPHQISLQSGSRHICGGSIISPLYVVTAAHCTDGQTADRLSVRAGSTTIQSGGTVVTVQRIHQHPNYNPNTMNYDISILELTSNLPYSSTIQAISLPSADQEPNDGILVTVTGWGALSQSGDCLSTILQKVSVNVVNRATCQSNYASEQISNLMLCAGVTQGGKDACQGDSGGPLIANNRLYGVVSWGYGCAQRGYPGVYANVASLRNFIRSITGV